MPDQPPARRTQQERREDTERKVLAAATALIAQHGSRALTLAAVGEAAGCRLPRALSGPILAQAHAARRRGPTLVPRSSGADPASPSRS